jgi:hypothetical protein
MPQTAFLLLFNTMLKLLMRRRFSGIETCSLSEKTVQESACSQTSVSRKHHPRLLSENDWNDGNLCQIAHPTAASSMEVSLTKPDNP